MHFGFVCLVNAYLIVASSLNIWRSSIVLKGDKLEIKCDDNGSKTTIWAYTSWNNLTEQVIYSDIDIYDSVKSRYKIDKNISGQHNLIIDYVDLAHAGRYECTSGIRRTQRTDLKLIVLGSHPACASNIGETQYEVKEYRYLHLYLWCSLNYTGNGYPVFSWAKGIEQQTVATNITTSGSGKELLANTSSIREQLRSNDRGVVFQCRITFRMSDRNTTNEFEYTWNYTLYGPKNVTIVEYEDRLECSADGNPTPIYRWTDVEANISIYGSIYMTNRTKEKDHTLECTATNIFAAENTNFTIKGRLITEVALVFPVTALAIGGSPLCFSVMAFIVLCVVHRKRQKDKTSHRPDVALHTGVTSYESGAGTIIVDNAVYAQVMKPKGPSKGNKGGNIGDSSKPHRATQDVTGADGTVYAELSGVKPPDRKGKGQVPKTPAFNKVEIYASIDHCGNASAPPLPPK